jgi:hypothetical protein
MGGRPFSDEEQRRLRLRLCLERTDGKHPEQKGLAKEAQFNRGPDNLPSRGPESEPPLNRVEQAETASNISKWLSSKISGKAC